MSNETPKSPWPIHPALHFDLAAKFASIGAVILEEVPGKNGSSKIEPRAKIIYVWHGEPGPKSKKGEPEPMDAHLAHEGGLVLPAPVADKVFLNRWDALDLNAFMKLTKTQVEQTAPSHMSILKQTRQVVAERTELTHAPNASYMACWAMGTYFSPLFSTFPVLNVMGEKGSGKTKLLQVIARIAFNGYLSGVPSAASIFRMVEALRPTLLMDEMENLSGEDSDLKKLVRCSYKKDLTVPRVEKDSHGQWVTKHFHPYGPVVVGSIHGLDVVTEDRAHTIVMERGTDPDKVNWEIEDADSPVFSDLRSNHYRASLTSFRRVDWARQNVEKEIPAWLTGRLRELYRMPLTMAWLAKLEGDPSFWNDLLLLAKQDSKDHGSLSDEGRALFGVLCALPSWKGDHGLKDVISVYPNHLTPGLRLRLDDPKLTPKKTGQLLRRYGFEDKKETNQGWLYTIRRARLSKQAEKYGFPLPDTDSALVDQLDLTEKGSVNSP
jgi:hypothetical protein